jgi:hypothetical protein
MDGLLYELAQHGLYGLQPENVIILRYQRQTGYTFELESGVSV